MMNIAAFKESGVVALLILLLLGATTVSARSPEPERGRTGQSAGFRYQDNGGVAHGDGKPEQGADQRQGKLSPDERRKLRRQIDEAGQDIYRVRR